jgi:hypothetical protein
VRSNERYLAFSPAVTPAVSRGVRSAGQFFFLPLVHAAREIFQKKNLVPLEKSTFYLFWAGFVGGLYGGGLNRKCQSFVRDLNFWAALHTPQQFSPTAHTSYHRSRIIY